jgi:ribosomal protein S27AE
MYLSLKVRLYGALAVFVAGGYLIHALLPFGSPLYIVAGIVLTAVVACYTMSLACPNCGASVILDAVQSMIPRIPAQCGRCGYPLD